MHRISMISRRRRQEGKTPSFFRQEQKHRQTLGAREGGIVAPSAAEAMRVPSTGSSAMDFVQASSL